MKEQGKVSKFTVSNIGFSITLTQIDYLYTYAQSPSPPHSLPVFVPVATRGRYRIPES